MWAYYTNMGGWWGLAIPPNGTAHINSKVFCYYTIIWTIEALQNVIQYSKNLIEFAEEMYSKERDLHHWLKQLDLHL